MTCLTDHAIQQSMAELESVASPYNISTFTVEKGGLPFHRSSLKPKTVPHGGVLVVNSCKFYNSLMNIIILYYYIEIYNNRHGTQYNFQHTTCIS